MEIEHPSAAAAAVPEDNMDMNALDRKMLTKAIMGMDITEIYSPERVNKVAQKFGLSRGLSLDLKTGWDFTLEQHRKKAWRHVLDDKPELVIGSPPCTMFSRLQELNRARMAGNQEWMEKHRKKWIEATVHVKFCVELYKHQLRHGRHFLHEHPHAADSWKLPEIEELLRNPGIHRVRADQCMYGLKTINAEGEQAPAMKPTGFMTSSWGIADELSMKCDRQRERQRLLNSRAEAAATYPQDLCKAICRGLVKQKLLEKHGVLTSKRASKNLLASVVRAA